MTIFAEASRAQGLARLHHFIPSVGAAYAAERNYDHGPEQRHNVSMLSPYIRHHLITQREVCAAVLQQHSLQEAEKFIQEIFWRSYWKGWLEMRPVVWTRYQHSLAEHLDRLEKNGGMARDYRAAVEGRTGIEGFDSWSQELIETGYLHNHARMWFASIWIFTLGLPWELGADFFYRHLLDGDPASNTLSWRWVAGLHTKGKTYAASRDNIAKYTGGRFSPSRGLARVTPAIEEAVLEAPQPIAPMPDRFSGEAALLLTEEDYGVDTLAIDWSRIKAIGVVDLTAQRTERGVSEAVQRFSGAAALDTIGRLARLAPHAVITPKPLTSIESDATLQWLRSSNANTVLVPETCVGPTATHLAPVVSALQQEGIVVTELRRSWDSATWPHAGKGFFALKEKIPEILRQEGLI